MPVALPFRWDKHTLTEGRIVSSKAVVQQRSNGAMRVDTVDGRVIVHGRSDSHDVKQLALAAVLEAVEASQSQSEKVDLDIEVAPLDGWQARRCALSETRDGNCSNELALTKEFNLTKEN